MPTTSTLKTQFKHFQKVEKRFESISHDEKTFKIYPDIALTSIRMTTGVYKVFKSNPELASPDIEPKYTLMSHGLFSHKYSLLPEQADRRMPHGLRPLAVYSTNSKHLTHAKILDISCIDLPEIVLNKWDNKIPSELRLCFTRDHNKEDINIDNDPDHSPIIEFQVANNYSYRWKKIEHPALSGIYKYYLHRQNANNGYDVLVARVDDSRFRSPIDGTRGQTLEIDSNNVNPVIAFISWLATSAPFSSFAQLVNRPSHLQPISPLYYTAFEDDPTRLLVAGPDSDKEDVSDDANSDGAASGSALDGSYHSKLSLIKVFNTASMDQFKIPDAILAHMNGEAEQMINSILIRYGIRAEL